MTTATATFSAAAANPSASDTLGHLWVTQLVVRAVA
jgi:hypothetical protein